MPPLPYRSIATHICYPPPPPLQVIQDEGLVQRADDLGKVFR